MSHKNKPPPLESGLLQALQALDNQVQREMQRTPAERDAHGVQKWEPYLKRIERLTGFMLEQAGEKTVDLDSLLILSQALTKTLKLLVEELGEEGLGKVRTSYCSWTLENVTKDAAAALELLGKRSLVS